MSGQVAPGADVDISDFDIGLGQSQKLAVYEVVKAKPQTAIWVQNLIEPALVICRVERARGIEFRPTGIFSGWFFSGRDHNPDGRISISSKAHMWDRCSLQHLYIHELTHALLDGESRSGRGDEFPGHCAAFFCLNLTLLLRLEGAKSLSIDSWSTRMSLYDLFDPPACWAEAPSAVWRPRALGWAMGRAYELCGTDFSAEKCANEIAKRYFEWCDLMAAEPAKIAQAQAAAARKIAIENATNSKNKSDLFLFKYLSFMAITALLSAVYFSAIR